MTEFYEIEVSREARVRQSVKVRVPMDAGLSAYSAEAAAKAYIAAAEKAGQPIAWVTGEATPSTYATLEAEIVGDRVAEPAPAAPEPAPLLHEPIRPPLTAPETVS